MKTKIAINGFGRIGRNVAKAILEHHKDTLEIVAINDLTDAATLAYLFQYDSFFGTYEGTVDTLGGSTLMIDGKEIPVYAEKDPSALPWGDIGVDVVLECTGIFKTEEACSAHIIAGAKKVIISAPPKDNSPMFVMGVNEEKYSPDMNIISNASCTTNCLAPVVKVVLENWGIESGMMTTIHSFTASQHLQDSPDKDLRKSRAATESMIPTSTGAAKSIGRVIPELAGKLDGYAIRIPTPDVSLLDVTFVTEKTISSKEDVIAVFKNAAGGRMNGILAVSDVPLVSIDYRKNPYSATVDSPSIMLIGKNMLKVVAWYDNEWGYSCRMADLAKFVGERI